MPFIDDLDPTTPLGGASAGGGNDAIQDLKIVLQDQFPNLDGGTGDVGVLPTTDEINAWPARLDALEALPPYEPPVGTIVMWSNSVGAVPAGWAYCNGDVVNGVTTPNMVGRFPLDGGIGGTDFTGGSPTATTDSKGAHSHTITVDDHTLTEAEMPSHSHALTGVISADNDTGNWAEDAQGSNPVATANPTGTTGGDQGHNHTASSNSKGAHTHEVDTVPPYYAIWFIMYVGTP